MERAEELLMYAEECRRMAGASRSEHERRAWNAMADQCEAKARIIDGGRQERRHTMVLRPQTA
jgi:hypothetical protein